MPDESKPKIEKRKFSGATLRRLRRQKRITVTDLAQLLQRDPSAISRWEHGETIPNAEDVWTLSQIFKVPMKALFMDPAAPAAEPFPSKPKEERDS